MKNPKNNNKKPFIILLLIQAGLMGYSFYKSKDKKQSFILLMSNIGMAYLFEFFVLNLFKAYKYKPRMLRNNYFDNILGAILSQAIFVPFTALFLTIKKIGWFGNLLGGIFFALVELLFLKLKVYKHNWWKTAYTLLLIPLYFRLSDGWNILLTKRNPVIRFVSLFFTILVTEANLLFVFAASRKIRIGLGKYHTWNEHFILVPLYAISLSFFSTLSFLKQNNWISQLRVLVMTMCIDLVFKKLTLVKEKFHTFNYIIIRLLTILLYGQYRDWVYGVSEEIRSKEDEGLSSRKMDGENS